MSKLQNQKGDILYITTSSGWKFSTEKSNLENNTKEGLTLFECVIEETERNTFLVKTRTNVIKEYFPSSISSITYKYISNGNKKGTRV